MGEKSRKGWGVKIDLCKKCHMTKFFCKCKNKRQKKIKGVR